MALQVVLDHLVGRAIEGPDRAPRSDVEQMQAGWLGVNMSFVQILSIFIEHLDAVVVPVVHENVAGLLVDGDPVHAAEIPRSDPPRRQFQEPRRTRFQASPAPQRARACRKF
jgi:hypothetical protein